MKNIYPAAALQGPVVRVPASPSGSPMLGKLLASVEDDEIREGNRKLAALVGAL